MGKKSEPEMTVSLLGANSTRIILKPDLAKFHMTRLDDDVIGLMVKRVFDMVALLGMTVKVQFNGEMIPPPRDFSEYPLPYLATASEGRESAQIVSLYRFQTNIYLKFVMGASVS
jgi:DNA topoisomerase-2